MLLPAIISGKKSPAVWLPIWPPRQTPCPWKQRTLPGTPEVEQERGRAFHALRAVHADGVVVLGAAIGRADEETLPRLLNRSMGRSRVITGGGGLRSMILRNGLSRTMEVVQIFIWRGRSGA